MNTPSPPAGGRFCGRRSELLALALLLLAEFVLFDQVGAKHVTWIYPRWNDQIQYLTESYLGYEFLRLHGLLRALWYTLTNPAAQGALHDFFAVLVFRVAGPSRSAALAVNALFFLAWQAALFLAVRRASGSRALAWTGAGLLLALASPWAVQPGSAFDFRLDWMAAASLGVTLAIALRTEGFRRRGWAVLFGLGVGVTVLIRFLSGTYLALIFAALFVWILAGTGRARRAFNLLAAGATAALVAGPILWSDRALIWSYYAIGHFAGPESSIRDSHLGLVSDFAWLFRTMVPLQFGGFWVAWVLAVTGLLAATRLLFRQAPEPAAAPGASGSGVLGIVFLTAPTLVLVLQPEKSFVVFSALLPGAIVCVLAGWHRLLRSTPRWAPAAVAAGTLLAGAGYYGQRMCRDPNPPGFEADARRVLTVCDLVYARSRAARLPEPQIGSDQVNDFFDGQVLRVICYERHHVWVPFRMTMPLGIMRAPPALIMERLEASDFVFLTPSGPIIDYPWDRQLRAMLPQTRAWCDAHLRRIGAYDIFGRHILLYERLPAAVRRN